MSSVITVLYVFLTGDSILIFSGSSSKRSISFLDTIFNKKVRNKRYAFVCCVFKWKMFVVELAQRLDNSSNNKNYVRVYTPEMTWKWLNAGLMLAQRLRRWNDVTPALSQRLASAGMLSAASRCSCGCRILALFGTAVIMVPNIISPSLQPLIKRDQYMYPGWARSFISGELLTTK